MDKIRDGLIIGIRKKLIPLLQLEQSLHNLACTMMLTPQHQMECSSLSLQAMFFDVLSPKFEMIQAACPHFEQRNTVV